MKSSFLFHPLIVGVVTILPCCKSAKVLYDYSLDLTAVARVDTTLYPTESMCYRVCHEDPSCTAVTPFKEHRGLFNCLIAETLMTYQDFVQTSGRNTLVKTVECDTANGFEQVVNVGCIKVFTNDVLLTEARDQCPPGSVMYAPTSLSTFTDLRAHLVCADDDPADANYHLDIIELGSNYYFRYFKGTFYGNALGTYYYRSVWFITNEPNDGSPRAFFLRKSELFKVFDDDTTRSARVICEMF